MSESPTSLLILCFQMSFVGIQNIPNQKDIFTPGWWQIFFSVCWNEVSYSWVIINPASITGEPNDPCIANLLVCFSRKTYTGPDALCLLRCQRTLKWCRERCAAESTAADKGRGVRSLVEFVMAGVGMHHKAKMCQGENDIEIHEGGRNLLE